MQRHVGTELDYVRRRHRHELRERAVLVQAVDLRADADVAVAGAALGALAADDVHLRGDVVADADAVAVGALADLLDEAAELVAVDSRRRHGVADRRVPVVDVLVGAADGRGGDADQDLVRPRLRVGTLADLRSGRTIDGV